VTPRRRTPVARKDGNHGEIVNAFEATGCSVVQTHLPPVPGWPDLIVGCVGVTHLVENKHTETRYGRAGLNVNQTAFARDWRGSPVHVVTSAEEAIELVQGWRKGRVP
jgi:hypothetical protein